MSQAHAAALKHRRRTPRKRCRKPRKLRVKIHAHKGGKRHRHYRCVMPKRRRRRLTPPVVNPPPPPAPAPSPSSPPGPLPDRINGVRVYRGPFGAAQAERLLWRAGFGPAPGQAPAVAAMGLDAAVRSLSRPAGPEVLTGPEPRANNGGPLFPADGHGDPKSVGEGKGGERRV